MKLKIRFHTLPGLSAVLCCAWLWPQMLPHAAPLAHQEQPNLHVLSWLRGARVKSADEAARDQIRRANDPRYLPQSSDAPETPSVSDQEQALGLAVRLAGGAQIYYDLHFAALARLGAVRYQRNGEESAPHSALALVPGDRLELGLRLCNGCTLSLGRRVPDPLMRSAQPGSARIVDRLSGGHGSLTGAHLSFAHPRYGGIAITPLYRPELSGSFLADGIHTQQSGQLSGDHAHNWQRDFMELAGKARSYAHRAACALRLGPALLGFDYALHRQDDTANPTVPETGPAENAQPHRFRRSVDHIVYAGVGVAVAGEIGQAYLHLQRSSGAYRTLLAGSADGPREATIEGVRLSTGFTARPGPLRLRARFTLPEPERAKRPGETLSERSGYIGFGNAGPSAPLLRDTLDFRPAPRLCPDSDRCSGIDRRNLRVDFAENRDARESPRDAAAFRDHAAVFEVQIGYEAPAGEFDRLYFEFGLSIFTPLAPRPAGGRNPFQRLKKDPLSFEYREFNLRVAREFGNTGALEFGYSRLYRRHRATGSLLAGESLRLGFRYHL